MTQYFDMLKEIGASSRTNAILIPHSPGSLTSLTEQMRNAMIEADQTVKGSDSALAPSPGSTTASDESLVTSGPRRDSVPDFPGNPGRTDAASLTERVHHG
jgi:hypothetical protein